MILRKFLIKHQERSLPADEGGQDWDATEAELEEQRMIYYMPEGTKARYCSMTEHQQALYIGMYEKERKEFIQWSDEERVHYAKMYEDMMEFFNMTSIRRLEVIGGRTIRGQSKCVGTEDLEKELKDYRKDESSSTSVAAISSVGIVTTAEPAENVLQQLLDEKPQKSPRNERQRTSEESRECSPRYDEQAKRRRQRHSSCSSEEMNRNHNSYNNYDWERPDREYHCGHSTMDRDEQYGNSNKYRGQDWDDRSYRNGSRGNYGYDHDDRYDNHYREDSRHYGESSRNQNFIRNDSYDYQHDVEGDYGRYREDVDQRRHSDYEGNHRLDGHSTKSPSWKQYSRDNEDARQSDTSNRHLRTQPESDLHRQRNTQYDQREAAHSVGRYYNRRLTPIPKNLQLTDEWRDPDVDRPFPEFRSYNAFKIRERNWDKSRINPSCRWNNEDIPIGELLAFDYGNGPFRPNFEGADLLKLVERMIDHARVSEYPLPELTDQKRRSNHIFGVYHGKECLCCYGEHWTADCPVFALAEDRRRLFEARKVCIGCRRQHHAHQTCCSIYISPEEYRVCIDPKCDGLPKHHKCFCSNHTFDKQKRWTRAKFESTNR